VLHRQVNLILQLFTLTYDLSHKIINFAQLNELILLLGAYLLYLPSHLSKLLIFVANVNRLMTIFVEVTWCQGFLRLFLIRGHLPALIVILMLGLLRLILNFTVVVLLLLRLFWLVGKFISVFLLGLFWLLSARFLLLSDRRLLVDLRCELLKHFFACWFGLWHFLTIGLLL
jgi:hypothetical protein